MVTEGLGWEATHQVKDLDELNRFVALVMGFYNSIAVVFETAPSEFEPTFYESRVRGKKVIIVDEWCVGFIEGMRMDSSGWNLLRGERPAFLRPIELFGRPTVAGGSGSLARSASSSAAAK
ncbi:MAG: UPF0149 family protein [Proteobacteria bacterium]|nr:UPF0149 family protein [Pseudomonadota bacterium]